MAINETVLRLELNEFSVSFFGLDKTRLSYEEIKEAFKLEKLRVPSTQPIAAFKVKEEYLSPPKYRRTREKTFVESSPLFSEFNAVFEPKRQPMMRAKNGKGKKK